MMRTRTLALVGAAVVAGACGGDGEEGAAASRDDGARTAVRITLDPDGAGPRPARVARVRCPSARWRLTCRRLRALPDSAFDPVPPDAVCTEIYGGPQVATIRGRIEGERVRARYSRDNGCAIGRYEVVQPVLRAAVPGRQDAAGP